MKFILSLICIILGISQVRSEVRYSITTKQISSKPTGATPEEFANNMRDMVLSAPQPTGYCFSNNPTFPLNNQSLCKGPNKNIGWIFNFVFDDAEIADYTLEFGTDFGYGAAIFIDDQFYTGENRDMWWAKNWSSNAVFRLKGTFAAGRHQIVVYGAEGCCDGQMDVRFSRNGSDFEEFSLENLKNEIPEPKITPRNSNGDSTCIYNWNCDEFEDNINQVCDQSDNNEYIECALDIIDAQLKNCTDVEKQPQGWGSEDESEEENPVPVNKPKPVNKPAESEPETEPETEPESEPTADIPPSECETCDEDIEEEA